MVPIIAFLRIKGNMMFIGASSIGETMHVVVSIPDEWFSHDFSGALMCPHCNEPASWEEIYVGSPSSKKMLMFKCAKCQMITRQLPVRKT